MTNIDGQVPWSRDAIIELIEEIQRWRDKSGLIII